MKPIASAGPIELETVPRKISLPAEKPLASWLETLGPGQHLYLVLRGLRADEQPNVLYHLYLGPGTEEARYIGTFNFYDAIPIRDDNEKETAPPSSGFNSYDITEVAKALRGRGMLSEPTTVTIQAGGAPVPGARPVIGKIELILQ